MFPKCNSIIRSLQNQEDVLILENGNEGTVFFPDLSSNNRKIYNKHDCSPKEKISTGGTAFKAKWMKLKEAYRKKTKGKRKYFRRG